MSAPFEDVPVNRWLGFRLLERAPSRVVIEQDIRDEMLQEGDVMQGGLLTALADTAAVYLLWPDLGPERTMIGTNVAMQFLGAGRKDLGTLRAVATPLRVGRTIAVCETIVHQGDRLICKGTFTFLIQDRR
ncbi:MAG: PaaI family thioesterase [Planctomycetota bacterium]